MATEWFWCLRHTQVESGDTTTCPPQDRLGPYESADAASHWQDRVDARNEAWDREDQERAGVRGGGRVGRTDASEAHPAKRRRAMVDNADELKGRAKQAAGDLTDNDDLKREGTIDKATGKVKSVVDRVADKAKD